MSVQALAIGAPFFTLRLITDEPRLDINGKAIVLNLSTRAIQVREQRLGALQSVILQDTVMQQVDHAIVIQQVVDLDDAELMARVRDHWPSAYQVRGEERLKGVEHYMSSKVWVGQFGFTLYHSASVPLNVGLHRDHAFCPIPGFREVHTQLVGFGKMQQCRERDVETLYWEEPMAPGTTHRPMYDDEGNYPWHQFETITPSIFMAVEMLPDGAVPPEQGS